MVRTGGFSVYIYIYISDGLCTYRNTRLLILRTLVQFYILPHTPACSICRACVRMLSHAKADSAWLLKQLENGSSRHRAFEADRGKHAYLHSGLQAGLQAYPRQWASNREGGTSLYLSRQIVHNTVGSLPLAKNALHSLTSI